MSDRSNKAFAVLVPEVIAGPAVTLGAVVLMEKIPKQMDSIITFVDDKIVSPHLHLFKNTTKGIRKAREEYDQKKNADLIAQGEPPRPIVPETPKQESRAIADGLVRTSFALGADVVGSYALQKILNKTWHAGISASKTSMVAFGVQIGAMIAMPTLFAKQSENLHFALSKGSQHLFGTSKEKADERARAFTYVSLPGVAASAASLLYALKSPGKLR